MENFELSGISPVSTSIFFQLSVELMGEKRDVSATGRGLRMSSGEGLQTLQLFIQSIPANSRKGG